MSNTLYQKARERDKLPINEAKNLFKDAADLFKKVNHWRGLHNTFGHLERLSYLEDEIMGENANTYVSKHLRKGY